MTNHHAAAYIRSMLRSGGTSTVNAQVANVIAEQFGTSGPVALAAAVAVQAHGVSTAHQARNARHGGITYDIVRAAIDAAEVDA